MSIYAPFRFLVAVAMALLIATVIASSTAHGMALGNAVAQSTLGSPLRAVIPISTAPGELLQTACFRVVSTGDGSAQTVTARVSLERTASAFQLVVTTEKAVNEPTIRFGIQAGCETMSRRDYVLLLDPQVAGAPAAAAAQPTAREPGQDRHVLPPAAARRNADWTPTASESRAAQRPTPAAGAPLERQRIAATGSAAPAAFHPIGTGSAARPASPGEARVAQTVAPLASVGGWGDAWTYLAASLAIAGVIALAALLMRQRNATPAIPQWTRGGAYAGPSTYSNLSSGTATLSPPPATLSPLSYAEATTVQRTPSDAKPDSVAPPPVAMVQGTAPRTHTNRIPADITAIDTLLDELDPDIVEERAVRQAWAAARSDVEREMDGNAILQAIEAAERDLLLGPPAPAQAAIDSSLDDELLHSPQRPDKAAA
ncbi:MAG TPA: hypothetical protein VGR42_04780 [Casimicrobiaceae bacterium]|nr:hypothetical protein [Casimicrobiaceae bacterium]